jgi:hypothetical protein
LSNLSFEFLLSLFFISFLFGILRFYVFGHLVTDENAIKPFPLTVKINIEPLDLDEVLLLHLLVLTFLVFNYIICFLATRLKCHFVII